MRDCKEWMDSPRVHSGYVRTASSQVLRELIQKEIRGATDAVGLDRRYSSMNASLREMFQREELSGATYSRLKIILRGEYEKRLEMLCRRDHGTQLERGAK